MNEKSWNGFWPGLLSVAMVSVWPVVNFVAENRNLSLSYWAIAIFAATSLVLCTVFWLGGFAILRGTLRLRFTGIAVFAVIGFFSFDSWRLLIGTYFPDISVTFSWLFVELALVIIGGALIRSRLAVRGVLVMAMVMVAIPTLSIIGDVLVSVPKTEFIEANREKELSAPSSAGAKNLPSVYYIVVDGYARSDFIMEMSGFDNTDFVEELKQRNFNVLEKSTSNYFSTEMSLSATLSMDYIFTDKKSKVNSYSEVVEILRGHNPSTKFFLDRKYFFLMAEVRWCSDLNDKCVVPYLHVPREIWNLLILTPVPVAMMYAAPDVSEWFNRSRYLEIDFLTKQIETVDARPVFLFAHTNVLHDVFYNEDCSQRSNQAEQAVAMMAHQDRMTRRTEYYVNSLRCVNRQLRALADAIIAEDPSAIIFFTSDHGSAFSGFERTEDDVKNVAFLNERTAIFAAVRLPERCRKMVRDDLSSVNHFRLVTACIEGQSPVFLPNRAYWAVANDAFENLRDVTEKVLYEQNTKE